MMLNDNNKKSFKKMLKGRALYLALSACLVAATFISLRAAGTRAIKKLAAEVTTQERVTHLHVTPRPTEPSTAQGQLPVAETPTLPALEEPQTAAVFDNLSPTVPASEAEPESESAVAPLRFQLPLGVEVGKDYSMGVPVFSQTMNDWRTHNGVDFRGEPGEGVQTIAPGTVIAVTRDPLWGNTVKIDHGQGVVSTVSGLADGGLIANGTTLQAGDLIGLVGEIPVEKEDPAHIHLEVRVDGKLRDPLELMGFVSDAD